ncbi:beta-lactamase family protein [Sandaracinobacter neustonicus]|uniref:Beta-lactamase family protein n=1 Tax=Sandaracinobacter neustonicus TaxID=1715348 RepID=A0A501XIX6_9SPHN|nr:serine hydrolase domain-containing protein [Sandaracinobacter neustonicus]TPE60500.1 beta-lactamase family protein [Sandaracinobacter neustonicus]
MNARARLIAALAGLAASILVSGPARAQTCAPPGSLSAADSQAIDRLVRDAMREHQVPGVTLAIVRDGRIIALKGYGDADIASGHPVDPRRTLFRIGSVTKLFTYTAALQQVEQGRLALDTDINRYLPPPGLRVPAGPPVTAQTIMGHRAGFETAGLGYDFFGDTARVPTLRTFVARHQPAIVRQPGDATAYSDFGPTALGLAVETVSGEPYAAYVTRHILSPLGMASTTLAEPVAASLPAPHGRMVPELAARTATAYASGSPAAAPLPVEHIFPAAAPAGSAWSTAADMACFALAWLNDGALGEARLLSPETVKAMRRRNWNDRLGATDFAHGWFQRDLGEAKAYQHTGGMLGFTANLLIVPERNIGLFIAGNSNSAWPLTLRLPDRILTRLDPALTWKPAPARPAPGELADYAGLFLANTRSFTRLEGLLALADEARVEAAGPDALWISLPGGAPERWTRIGRDLFESPPYGDRIRFVRDAQGDVVRFYHPMGHRGFDRIPFWRSALLLWLSLALTMGLGAVLLGSILALRWQHERRALKLTAAATAIIGITLPAIGVAAARALEDPALAFHWPPPALRLLVGWGYAAALAAIALFAMLPAVRPASGLLAPRRTGLLSALSLGASVILLWLHNLFAPAMQ